MEQEGLGPKRKVASGAPAFLQPSLTDSGSRVGSICAKVHPVSSTDPGAAVHWASVPLLLYCHLMSYLQVFLRTVQWSQDPTGPSSPDVKQKHSGHKEVTLMKEGDAEGPSTERRR